MVKVEHNRAEEVTTHSEEVIDAARMIRRGADRDLLQAQVSIRDLTRRAEKAESRFAIAWGAFEKVAKVVKTRADSGKPWTEFFPNVPERFCSFIEVYACASLRNTLAQIGSFLLMFLWRS